ncbi:hypothetical protein HDU67_007321 [Dinochytrium kinnereticum]|nr:hypothetical protein HDU67_007321 [Dinochytrium kinnereticum]
MRLKCIVARKGVEVTVDVEDDETILDIKRKVHEEKGYAVERQVIMVEGPEFLKNSQTIRECGIKESDIILIGLSKTLNIKNETEVDVETKLGGNLGEGLGSSSSSSSLTLGSVEEMPESTKEYSAAVESLTDMGFSPGDVVAAMKAAFYDADRAAEYLMTGMPSVDAHLPATIKGKESFAPGFSIKGGAASKKSRNQKPPPKMEDNWEQDLAKRNFLMNHPIIQSLKDVIFDYEEDHEPYLTDLQETQPELVDAILDNPDILIHGIMGPTPYLDSDSEPDAEADPNPTSEDVATEIGDSDDAVGRLVAMGFERDLVSEVLAACDGDEQNAANVLFDMMSG